MSQADEGKAHESVPAPSARQSRERAMDRLFQQLLKVPSPKTLAHLVRFLGTWTGTDKFFMLAQYGSNVLVAVLLFLHALRKRSDKSSVILRLVPRIRALGSLTADARILFRIWAILPMVKWMLDLERHLPLAPNLKLIERLQALSMVVYAPMEAAAYLAMHKILPLSDVVQNELWLWGCRLWAAYVVLDFWHIVEDHRILRAEAKALERSHGHPTPAGAAEKAMSDDQKATQHLWTQMRARKEALLTQFWVNVGYLPLTVHWSVSTGLISEGWVGVFGMIAGLASWRKQWKATA